MLTDLVLTVKLPERDARRILTDKPYDAAQDLRDAIARGDVEIVSRAPVVNDPPEVEGAPV